MKKNKRFLFLITHYVPQVYGAELFAQKLAEHLVKKGNTVDLITGRWHQAWPSTETIQGVHVYRVPVSHIRYIQTLYFILPQWIKARELLQKNKYDYIHAHIFPSLITAAWLPSKAQKIITIQGGDLADYPEIYGPAAPVLKTAIGKSLEKYDQIHTVSRDLQNQVFQLTKRSTCVIPNGVESSWLEYQVPKKTKLDKIYSLKEVDHVIFSPSRLTNKNNLINTIQAIAAVRQKGYKVGLLIAGQGHLEKDLKMLIHKHKANNQIQLLGRLDHKQVMELCAASDYVIRASTQEGFGISLLEGLAVGTPVIATQSGGLADFISEDVAYVVESPSAVEIEKTIIRALQDKNTALKVKAAKELVAEKYIWEKVLKQTEKLYI